jgi:hypothetical protein
MDVWTLDLDAEGTCWLVNPAHVRVCYGDAGWLARLCIDLNRYRGACSF